MEHPNAQNGQGAAKAEMDYKSEEDYMANGYGAVNPSEVATLSLLGNGVDGGIFGHRTREAFDGTVVNNNVERNALDINTQNQFTRDTVREAANDRKLSDILFQNNDFRRETQAQISDLAAQNAKCCCDIQLLVTKENNETRTLLLEQRIQQQDREMAKAQADCNNQAVLQQMQLQTQILSQICMGGNGGNGHCGGGNVRVDCSDRRGGGND